MPQPGDPWTFSAQPRPNDPSRWRHPDAKPGDVEPDTSYLCVVDADGNARGRPVGVAIDKAGALLVADDVGNTVWRVTPAAK